jgi:hypothetical protein
MTVIRQKTDTVLSYLPGFGNEHVSEAIPGVLPAGPDCCRHHRPHGRWSAVLGSERVQRLRSHRRLGGPARGHARQDPRISPPGRHAARSQVMDLYKRRCP